MTADPNAQTGKPCAPTTELGSDHLVALSLVGTVALPSPFPATARVFVVQLPPPPQVKDVSARNYHIKIVQKINDSCAITRFVDHNAVKLIRFQTATEGVPPELGPFSLDQAGVQKLVGGLDWKVIDDRASHEIEPFPQHTGVVHVPENQPVLLRYELSVPAATSLEQLMSRGATCPHGFAHSC